MIAGAIDAAREMAALDDLIGAILGTRNVELATPAARAAHAGLGFDPRRIELFEALHAALLKDPLESRSGPTRLAPDALLHRGVLLELDRGDRVRAARSRGDRLQACGADDRFEDAHDVLGTFDVVNNPEKRRRTPSDPEDLLALLRSHHAVMLERRPQVHPGAFKTRANRAGSTSFVHPDLVVGTLVEGYRYYEPLPSGLAKAIFMMFLIGEVHPFTDGNGRVARVLMNAELSAAGEQRIVIPIVYRDDYLRGLRALSRNANPQPLIRVLDFAQAYAAAIDWSDLPSAERMLERTNAFVTPDLAEERDVRLELP